MIVALMTTQISSIPPSRNPLNIMIIRDRVTKPTAQIGFIKYVLLPLFEALSKVGRNHNIDDLDQIYCHHNHPHHLPVVPRDRGVGLEPPERGVAPLREEVRGAQKFVKLIILNFNSDYDKKIASIGQWYAPSNYNM